MKKVMLFIASMLFAASTLASPLPLTMTGGFGIYDTDYSAQHVQGVSGSSWTANFGVMSTTDSSLNVVVQENTAAALNVSSVKLLDASSTVVATATSTSGGQWTLWGAILSGVSYSIAIIGAGTGSVTATAVSAVPVPAALFLFAPALLGFLGLRRRASALTA